MVLVVKKETGAKPIDWFQDAENGHVCSDATMNYLRKHNFKLVREVVDRQTEIPAKYWKDIKFKLGLDFMNAKVVKKKKSGG